MNVQNKTLRVLGTIGGVLFSILLIFALIVHYSFPLPLRWSSPKPL